MKKANSLFSPAKRRMFSAISVIIALLMAFSPASLGVLAAEETETTPVVYRVDFENYTEGGASHITKDNVRNGNNAVVLTPTSGAKKSDETNSVYLMDTTGKVVEREIYDDTYDPATATANPEGYEYLITFYAKASDDFAPDYVRIDAAKNKYLTSAAAWLMSAPSAQWTTAAKVNALKNDWQLAYIPVPSMIKGDVASAVNKLSIFFNDSYASTGTAYTGKVYIDDAAVVRYEASTETVVILDGNYIGAVPDFAVGTKGAAMTLPTPTRDNAKFIGWYTDSACTTAYTGTTYPTAITRLYAKWEKTQHEIGFENCTDEAMVHITNEVSRSGGSAAVLTPQTGVKAAGANNAIRFTLDNQGDRVEKNDTDTFLFAFYAKASTDFDTSNFAANSLFRIDAARQKYVGSGVSWWTADANAQWSGSTELAAIKNDWQLGYIQAKPIAEGFSYMSLYYSDNNSVYTAGKVYIDDVIITKYDSATQTAVIFDGNYSGAKLQVQAVTQGAEITALPTPVREGYIFKGWYTNAACTTAYTSVTYPTTVTRLYAKWIEAEPTIGFENYTNGNFSNITTEVARTGNTSAVLTPVAGKSYPGSENSVILNINDNGTLVERADGYKMFTSYYIKASADYTTDLSLRIDHGKNKYYTDAGTHTYGKWLGSDSNTSNWNTESKLAAVKEDWQFGFIDTAAPTDVASSGWNYLSLYYNAQNSSEVSGKVYIDDVYVLAHLASESVVILDNNDGSELSYIHGTIGEAITNAKFTPVRDGYVFKGWYTDSAFTKQYTAGTYPEKATYLYAKWEEKVLFEAGFEDNALTANSVFSLNNDSHNVKSGDYSLKFVSDEDGTYYALLTEDGKNIELENGARYAVNYSYKIVDPDNTLKYLKTAVYRLNPAMTTKVALVSENLNNPTATTTRDKWLDYSYTFVADLTDSSAANIIGLYAYIGTDSIGNTAEIYFDDITVRKIRDTETSATFVYNDMDGSKKATVGAIGTAAETPELTKEYYALGGWCSDEQRTDIVTDIKYTAEDTVYYADWHLQSYKQDFEDYSVSTITSDTDTEINDRIYLDDPFVHSGNSALHRIGDEAYNKQFSIMCDEALYLKSGRTYTVSMYVKILNSGAEGGAISLVNTKSPFNPWSYDEANITHIVSVSDIEKGVWTKVSVDFTAADLYLAVRTPANCELYIDDIVVYDSSIGYEEETYPEVLTYAAGDTDHSGTVDSDDLVKLRRILLGVDKFDYLIPVDVNGDYDVNILDLIRLKKQLVLLVG